MQEQPIVAQAFQLLNPVLELPPAQSVLLSSLCFSLNQKSLTDATCFAIKIKSLISITLAASMSDDLIMWIIIDLIMAWFS